MQVIEGDNDLPVSTPKPKIKTFFQRQRSPPLSAQFSHHLLVTATGRYVKVATFKLIVGCR